ncbi:MAG: hypothetical protein AMJ88_06855 [Anaerolineae bacterium SM23_ 63]|nr:MAG: hypothetical protein AMJ88_06855 [Anaerolineae bacterium SM23_ 63]HEY46853.1 nitroreductase [Anaerolineae bacterium]
MLNISKLIIDGGIFSAIASLYLFMVLYINPRLFLQDYPEDIQRAVPQKSREERRLSILLGTPFLLLLFAGPFISTLTLKHQSGGELSFIVASIHAFGIVFIFNLVDWLILDWLIFCSITPGFLVIPGTEGMAGYKDYAFHFRAFRVGTVLSIVAGCIIGALVTIL